MELESHVVLVRNIFRAAVNEEFGGEVPEGVKDKIYTMVREMVEAEKRWGKYATKGLLGFSDKAIDIFVESRANSVCANLMIPLLYKEESINPLEKLMLKFLVGDEQDTRQNFFEQNVLNYNKGGMTDDW